MRSSLASSLNALSAPNINHLWALLLVDELVRQGVGLFVVCPGSRSTPLAVAVAEADAEVIVHWDERAAAFVALGWGRATGRPAAVITTSGTAVANLLPAAVEADADSVPLLLLTADRPPELRETGANQTIRQPPIFADVARWSLDWPVPTPDVPARWVLSTAAFAVHRAVEAPGPVHLNLPFREPLGRQPDGMDAALYLSGVSSWREEKAAYTEVHGVDVEPRGRGSLSNVDPVLERLAREERGVVVVGALPTHVGGDAVRCQVRAMAAALGWPILPDVRSGLRILERDIEQPEGHDAWWAPHVDALLLSEAFRELHRPQAVLHIGGRLVSKRLGQFLKMSAPPTYVQLSGSVMRDDPDALITHRVAGDPKTVLSAWADRMGERERGVTSWSSRWSGLSGAIEPTLETITATLNEPMVARTVASSFATVVAAASMPIRDLELVAPSHGLPMAAQTPTLVVANRGASGIDGTIATAVGVARGTDHAPHDEQGGVVALVGDLALLHDQTSLALLREGPPVVVVVINNDGGGIFHRLPIAAGAGELAPDTFERFFGTPHGFGFEDAARQFGLAYRAPESTDAFASALRNGIQSGASALIEVRTDREEQAALRRQLEAELVKAVDHALANLGRG